MTTQPSAPEDSEEVLAKVASQVAQQSRTLALHVRQHDDIEAAAQQKADAVIENLRVSLESAHQAAVEGAAGNIQSELDREFRQSMTQALDEFRTSLGELTREHTATLKAQLQEIEKTGAAALSNATETIRNEREEQRAEYQQLRTDTTNTLTELMNTTLEENSRATKTNLAEHSRTVEREQTERTEAALAIARGEMEEVQHHHPGGNRYAAVAILAVAALAVTIL